MKGERTNLTKEVDKDGNESVTYRKSWEKNGLNCSKEVRKVEGGYIVTVSKHGKPKDMGEDAEWIDERREFVTTENPFKKENEKNEEKEEHIEKMFDFVDKPHM